VPTSIIAIID